MKTFLFGALALVLMGAGCSFGSSDSVDWDYDDGGDEMEWDASAYQIPDGWDVDVQSPVAVSVGDEVIIAVTVTNNTGEDQVLHSIDIGQTYLEGVAIISTDPVYSDSFLLDDGTYTHFFLVDVANGESATVTFTGKALSAGDYQGALDVCIDDGLTCNFLQVRTVID